ncbi:hypothetical protein ACH5RR_039992 [Cinchona calisaya]|uniref:Auxin-responsive protein n=1 Tax=Cinchona calisaya TaxID=153742 RepID=A0ABD2Y528_9GENT
MELELGLALPVSSSSPANFPNKIFDLNINKNALQEQHSKERVPVELGNVGLMGVMEFKNLMTIRRQKRSFAEAFGEEVDGSKTLSLLVWNGRQPNDEEDGNGQQRKPFINTLAKNEEEDYDEIVGWPPIKSWRKKLFHGDHYYHQERALERANIINGPRNSMFVKVKMEGVVIGRKIDLMLFNSYQALTNTLLNMFTKYRKGDKDDGPYILSYLDKEGDWLLAGDVPWQIFIESAQRMEILKRSS